MVLYRQVTIANLVKFHDSPTNHCLFDLLSDDDHLALTGGTVCMERVGAECNRAWCGPGTKTCSSTTDQVWTSSVAGDDGPQEPAAGTQIHPNYVQSKCVTVTGTAANGAAVNV